MGSYDSAAALDAKFSEIAKREKCKTAIDTTIEVNDAITVFNTTKKSGFFNNISQNAILIKWGLFGKVSVSDTPLDKKKSPTVEANTRKNESVRLAVNEARKNIVEETENDSPDIRKYKFGKKNRAPYCAWGVNWFCTRGQGMNENLFGLSDDEVGSSQTLKMMAERTGCFRDKNKYLPKPGDIIVYSGKNWKGHVGLVVSIDDKGGFDTVEANSHETVERIHYNSVKHANTPYGADGRQSTQLAGFIDMEDYYKKHPKLVNSEWRPPLIYNKKPWYDFWS